MDVSLAQRQRIGSSPTPPKSPRSGKVNSRSESETNRDDRDEASDFERLAKERQSSLVGEFLHMIIENRNWWLIPIVVVLLLVSVLLVLGSTGAAPFIYTLF